MKDKLSNDLNIGDTVLVSAEIVSLNPAHPNTKGHDTIVVNFIETGLGFHEISPLNVGLKKIGVIFGRAPEVKPHSMETDISQLITDKNVNDPIIIEKGTSEENKQEVSQQKQTLAEKLAAQLAK